MGRVLCVGLLAHSVEASRDVLFELHAPRFDGVAFGVHGSQGHLVPLRPFGEGGLVLLPRLGRRARCVVPCLAHGRVEPLGCLRLPHHELGGVCRLCLPADLCDPRVERLLDLARCRRPLAPAPGGQGDELAQADVGRWRWRRLRRGEGPRDLVGDGRDFADVNGIAGVTDVWLGYLSRCGVDPSDRDDLFQEVFLSVHTAAHRFDASRRVHPWLFTIVANSTRSYFRKQRVRQLVFAEPRPTAVDPEPRATTPDGERSAVASQTLAWLERQIPQLPLRQREVLLLACVERRPLKEIAQILGMPLNTIKTHLRRARLSLAHKLARARAPEGSERQP